MKRDKIYSNSSLNIIRLVGSTKMWFSARWLQKPWYCNSGTWEGSWTFQWKIFGCSWTNLSARGWRGKIPLFKIWQLWISSHASFHCGFQVELAFELQDFYGITGTALGWGKGEGGITTGKLGSQKKVWTSSQIQISNMLYVSIIPWTKQSNGKASRYYHLHKHCRKRLSKNTNKCYLRSQHLFEKGGFADQQQQDIQLHQLLHDQSWLCQKWQRTTNLQGWL